MAKEIFDLKTLLGTGGFAQTWKAKVLDQELIEEWGTSEVAVKIPLSSDKERLLKRKELILIASLQLQLSEEESRNIVKYLSFEICEGKTVMVMEFVKDGSLRDLLGGKIWKWKKLEIDTTLKIISGVLKGLSVIHNKNIVHRDIKPENILMDNGIPKIADLGIGRILTSNDMASTTVGTLYYMSPEILMIEQGASYNTDIWSLGITMYEMIYGQFPFGISQLTPQGQVLQRITDDTHEIEFPTDVNIPHEIKKIIKKSLVRDPKKRYLKSEDMLEDINNFLNVNKKVPDEEINQLKASLAGSSSMSEVEKNIKNLLKKFPEDYRLYLHYGQYYNRIGNCDKAIKMFKKGIEISPEEPILHWDIAFVYLKSDNNKKAIDSILKAIDLGLPQSLEKKAKSLLRLWKTKL